MRESQCQSMMWWQWVFVLQYIPCQRGIPRLGLTSITETWTPQKKLLKWRLKGNKPCFSVFLQLTDDSSHHSHHRIERSTHWGTLTEWQHNMTWPSWFDVLLFFLTLLFLKQRLKRTSCYNLSKTEAWHWSAEVWRYEICIWCVFGRRRVNIIQKRTNNQKFDWFDVILQFYINLH